MWRDCLKTQSVLLTVCTWLILEFLWVSGSFTWSVDYENTCNHRLCLISDVGFEIPNRFVVGYALDYNEYFRDLNVSWGIFYCTVVFRGRSIKRMIWFSNTDYHTNNRYNPFYTEHHVLSFDCCFSLSAYLCDQWKWEDEIQDLTKQNKDCKRGDGHRRHVTASLNIFPEIPFAFRSYRNISSKCWSVYNNWTSDFSNVLICFNVVALFLVFTVLTDPEYV